MTTDGKMKEGVEDDAETRQTPSASQPFSTISENHAWNGCSTISNQVVQKSFNNDKQIIMISNNNDKQIICSSLFTTFQQNSK